MMQSNGADVLKLPVPELSLLIHRNKIVDKTTPKPREMGSIKSV